MRIRLILTVWLLIFGLSGYSSAIPPDELPFGSMYLDIDGYSDTSEVRKLAEDMCFNYFVDYWHYIDTTNIPTLYSYGMQAIRGGVTGFSNAEAPMYYSNAIYAEIELGDPYPNDEVRMESFGDSADFVDDVWVSKAGSPGDTLSGISTYVPPGKYAGEPDNRVGFYNRYVWGLPVNEEIDYQVDIDMKIDAIGDTSDVVVAVNMEIGIWDNCEMHIHPLGSVKAGEFVTADSFHTISRNFDFPDSIVIEVGDCTHDSIIYIPTGSSKVYYLTLSIATTGEREVTIDKIVISDSWGRDLIAGYYDEDISDKFEEYAYQDSMIYGWMLFDEPLWPNFRPFRHIDLLMHAVCTDWVTFTDNWHYQPIRTITHSYLDIVGADFLNPDIYPFGYQDGYAGDAYQGYLNGPLYDFNNHLSWVRKAVDEDDKDFWVTIQAMEHSLSAGGFWRFPTGPELSANTFMALAWGCKGIQYWFYDAIRMGNYPKAIRDNSQNPTVLYDQIRDRIGPYIKAIDSTYMSLTWDTVYAVHQRSTPVVNPPTGAWIDSIYAVSDTPNPDLGWFHVGQFTDGSDKYVMLVNRACSQGPDNPAPAPSVTATINFKSMNLEMGNHVNIIDLATNTSATDWVGTPDTTRAESIRGIITYSTELGPGEGRLFKIVQSR